MECPNPDIECEECEHFVADDDGNDYCYCASGKRKDDIKEIEAFLREKEPFMFEWGNNTGK